ncbi:hypothetical protein [Streptomyces sp. NPDC057382]|uniref:hypothetical protein n=1 Tax=unclassified Streptomyces TaxID=2593676 RepID=UPI00363DC249
MPPTLGELYEAASRNLRTAAAAPLAPDDPHRQAAVVRLLGELVGHLQSALEHVGERPRRVNPGPATHLAAAQGALRRTARRLPTPEDETLGNTALARTVQAVAAVQDLIASHRGQDGAPVTPYALAFTEQPARAYLVHSTADLAWGAARVAQALSEVISNEGTAVQLYVARGSLDQASVFGRDAGRHNNSALAAFPLALPLDPRPALPTDATGTIPAHLADDCERLSRAAFESLHGRGQPSLSGSDLKQLARWRAMNNLLCGRALLQAAAHADSETAEGLRQAADRLRTAAQVWEQSAARWGRIVDLADPRAHPKLPLPSYDVARGGQLAPMPKTSPHPALLIAHASATRMGQLLYGMAWNPETPGRPLERDVREVLADAGGLAELTQTVYRAAATGWQLAVAMPAAIGRIKSTLVTDDIDHRPPDSAYRFYPVPDHQVRRLTERYENVAQAEQAAAASILRTAPETGMDTARAQLDAAAHRQIQCGQPWLPGETTTKQPENKRPSPQAARSRSTTVITPARQPTATARDNSTTRRGTPGPDGPTRQAQHLRRSETDPGEGHKSTQR